MSGIDIFKLDVRHFNTIDNEIKELNLKIKPMNEKIKSLKLSKKELEEKICKYMSINEIDQCELGDSILCNIESKKKQPLVQKTIKEIIFQFVKNELDNDFLKQDDEYKTDKIFNYIYKDNRTFVETHVLKRQ